MSTSELKEQLISKIQITNEDYILEGLLRLWEFESNNSDIYKFNVEQRARIKNLKSNMQEVNIILKTGNPGPAAMAVLFTVEACFSTFSFF
jgi:hypothetical protein